MRRILAEQRGEAPESHRQLSYLFYDFHNYEISAKMTTRLNLLLFSNFIATLLTNPLDVVLTKLATQQPMPP